MKLFGTVWPQKLLTSPLWSPRQPPPPRNCWRVRNETVLFRFHDSCGFFFIGFRFVQKTISQVHRIVYKLLLLLMLILMLLLSGCQVVCYFCIIQEKQYDNISSWLIQKPCGHFIFVRVFWIVGRCIWVQRVPREVIDESRERVKGVQIKHVPHTKTIVAQQKEIERERYCEVKLGGYLPHVMWRS